MFLFFHRNKFPKTVKSGWMPVVDGHEIYFHTYGNPSGKVVLVFHGGPGGSSKVKHTTNFDLKRYYLILFDQRGCGKTKSQDILYKNTPLDAVCDAKRLLEYLGVSEKIVSNGGSYGSMLATLFAETYPEMVSELWIASIFLGRVRDVQQWQEYDAIRFYPDMIGELKKKAGKKGISEYFANELFSGNKKREQDALKFYGSLERIVGDKKPEFKLPEDEESYEKELKSLKVYANMVVNNFFLADNYLVKHANKIAHIPTVIFHNRLDMCCPLQQAWDLHKALPNSVLHIVPAAGHGSPEMNAMLKEFFCEKR